MSAGIDLNVLAQLFFVSGDERSDKCNFFRAEEHLEILCGIKRHPPGMLYLYILCYTTPFADGFVSKEGQRTYRICEISVNFV